MIGGRDIHIPTQGLLKNTFDVKQGGEFVIDNKYQIIKFFLCPFDKGISINENKRCNISSNTVKEYTYLEIVLS